MKLISFFISSLLCFSINAQYTTPDTGVVWNMDSLVQNSTAIQLISTNNYLITEDLTISASDSVFIIDNNVQFSSGVRVTVSDGGLYINGGTSAGNLIADQQGQTYDGFRLEGTAHVIFDNVTITDCGGIRVLTPYFKLQNSTLENCVSGVNTSGAIQVSTGKPELLNNVFKNNEFSAISSAANATVAPIIRNNIFEGNVAGNTNRPQLNLSPSGANDTTYIEDNLILGNISNEMAGGIAFSALAGGFGNVIIRNNQISNNRYGITVLGNNLFAVIDNNEIVDNNTQNSPNLGGSGINFNGDATSSAKVSNNQISGNLWGVTILGNFNVNLGDSHIGGSNLGLNTFSENTNGGQTYALFNNTPNQIYATNNCWELTMESTLQHAENVISHNVDDNTLGEVIFDPILNCDGVGVEVHNSINNVMVYPNPVRQVLHVEIPKESVLNSINLVSLTGRRLTIPNIINENGLEMNLANISNGVYFLVIQYDAITISKKVIVE